MENNRRYRIGYDVAGYHRKTAIGCVICLLLGIGATLGVGYAYFYDHDAKLVDEYVTSYEAQIYRIKKDHEEEVKKLNATIDDITEEAALKEEELTDQMEEVLRIHQEQQELSAADFGLLRKYWYVLRDAPNDGTITLDVLRFADDQCKKWDINPHWLWHMYEHESQWITTEVNSGSGARGIGQVLPSTGKSYWENVLGHGRGTFNVAMLDDPMVNIEITTAHLGRDLQNGSTWKEAVRHYCGGGVDAYWNVVVRYAKEHGITLTENNYHYQ